MGEEAREGGCWGHPNFGPTFWEGLNFLQPGLILREAGGICLML